MAIFASFQGWGTIYFFGSLIRSIGGIVITPIQVIAQILQLRRLKEALKLNGAAPLAATFGSPA